MQLIRGFYNLPNHSVLTNGCVLSIGNFDGVHLGHQQILARLINKSIELGLPSVVMLFEPQPREFFAKKVDDLTACNVPARLMRLRDKLKYLEKSGIDFVLCVRFSERFSKLTAEEFIQDLLVKQLKVRYLSVGDDFRFGAKRAGDYHTLQEAGKTFDFTVEESHTHSFEQDRISSSLIRELLQKDKLALVEKLLGKPYSIAGRVAHGNKLGRTIGFPTANIMLNRLVVPIHGVYMVRVETKTGTYQGIANIGNRPTINGTKPLLEVHIFDFNTNLYAQHMTLFFEHYVRPNRKFASLDELQEQIQRDETEIRAYFGEHK